MLNFFARLIKKEVYKYNGTSPFQKIYKKTDYINKNLNTHNCFFELYA